MRNFLLLLVGVFTVISNAKGEFVGGVQTGTSSTFGEFVLENFGQGASAKRAKTVGIFGQYRYTSANGVILGIHANYVEDSVKWASNRGINANNFVATKVKIDHGYDVLGLIAFKGKKFSPVAMVGFTSRSLEALISGSLGGTPFSVEDTLVLEGLKIAFGAEFPIGSSWLGYVLLEYAEYGSGALGTAEDGITIDGNQTGIRFGLGYKF